MSCKREISLLTSLSPSVCSVSVCLPQCATERIFFKYIAYTIFIMSYRCENGDGDDRRR